MLFIVTTITNQFLYFLEKKRGLSSSKCFVETPCGDSAPANVEARIEIAPPNNFWRNKQYFRAAQLFGIYLMDYENPFIGNIKYSSTNLAETWIFLTTQLQLLVNLASRKTSQLCLSWSLFRVFLIAQCPLLLSVL